MLRFFKRPPLSDQAPLINNVSEALQVTYKARLEELHTESLSLQKRFLDVVVQIRENCKADEPIDEVLLYKRDMMYKKFNKILNLHRRLRNYVERNEIQLNDKVPDDIWTRI
jgi:hypothetical protein